MIRLALLLIGADALRHRWRGLTLSGLLTIGLAALLFLDALDGKTVIATAGFGYLLLVSGALGLFGTLCAEVRVNRMVLLRAAGLLLMGLLIVARPGGTDVLNSVLFGLAFIIDGVLRIAGAYVLRFRHWRLTVAGGLLELGLALLAVTDWPVSYQQTVPFCIALFLAMSGATLMRLALRLRQLPEGGSILAIPGFGPPGWYERVDAAQRAAGPALAAGTPMVVRVWTPAGSAELASNRPVIDRYIAAVDKDGRMSTGHAVLDFAPQLYISHYPRQETERPAATFFDTLRATTENDVPGLFQPSYRFEVDTWFPADAHISFRRFDAARLATHWAHYQRDHTYNFTRRNCSVAVAVALDAALEGAALAADGDPASGRGAWRRLPRLLLNPDLWVAATLRRRAETLTWTPVMVYDYARALRRVVEPQDLGRIARLRDAWRLWRHSKGSQIQDSGDAITEADPAHSGGRA